MAEPAVEIQARDLQDLVRQLRALEDGKQLKKELRTAMREAGKPMLAAARAGVLATPSSRQGRQRSGPGLRRSTAKAMKLQVRAGGRGAGLSVRVDPRKMPAGMNNLPAYLDGMPRFERWRHPVFGRRDDTWVENQRAHPYFMAAIQPHIAPAFRKVEDALDTIRRELEA